MLRQRRTEESVRFQRLKGHPHRRFVLAVAGQGGGTAFQGKIVQHLAPVSED